MVTVATSLRTSRGEGQQPWAFRQWPLLRWLRSRELALALLALVVAAAVGGTLVPQSVLTAPGEYAAWKAANPAGAALAEAAGLTGVYQSWWFLALLGCLFLSLLVCTVSRVRQVWKLDRVRHRKGRDLPRWVSMAGNHSTVVFQATPSIALQRARQALCASGYHVRQDPQQGYLFGEKGRPGIWGSTLLHVGIMVILLGGVYSGAGKMVGYVELAEGQAFTDRREDFLQIDQGPLSGEPRLGFQMRLERLQPEHWEDGQLRAVTSSLTLLTSPGQLQPATVSINRPLALQGTTVYQANRFGFAALLALNDAQGRAVATGYVNFPTPKEPAEPATNRFALPRTELEVAADLHLEPRGQVASAAAWRQKRPDQPWLYLFLRDREGGLVYQGALPVGQAVPVGDSSLSFVALSRWAGYPVVRDPGLPVIYAGFVLCALGAAVVYLVAPRRVWAWTTPGPGGQLLLCLGGRADKFQPAFAEELQELAQRMESRGG